MESRNLKSLRIIRVLLKQPDGSLTKYKLAKLARCTKPWVIEFLRKLEQKKLVKRTKVLNIDKLIDYYLEIVPRQKHFDFYVQEPIKLLQRSKLDYALTTYAAENFTSYQLFLTRYDVYINEEDLDKWKALISKNGLIGKGNLRLIITNDKLVFEESQIIRGINIVSLPQLLIDLKKEGGVCIEAYDVLIKNVQRH